MMINIKLIALPILIVLTSCSSLKPDKATSNLSGEKNQSFQTDKNFKGKITVEYFWQESCRDCKRVDPIIKKIKKELPYVAIQIYDCKNQDNVNLFREKCVENNVPIELRMNTPSIFIGNKYLINDDVTYDNLKNMILQKQKVMQVFSRS
jgi:thiol-disulfide isomerase/thioredoxin